MIKPDNDAHWYDRHGKPCHQIKGKNGNMRSPYAREAKALGLVPSVTTILDVQAKPGLEAWKQYQILLSALTHPNPEKLGPDEMAKVIIKESKEEGKKAAEFGKRIHRAIEDYFRGEIDG